MSVPFGATHRLPPGGLPVWDAADASKPPVEASGDLDVRLVSWVRDWAQVEFSNAWVGWVDGRALLPIAPVAPSPSPVIGVPVAAPKPRLGFPALVGAALVLISPLLAWVAGPPSTSAFHVPVKFLARYHLTSKGGPQLGYVFITLGLVSVGLWLRRAPVTVFRATGGLVLLVAAVYVVQMQRAVGSPESLRLLARLGLGVYVAIAGGVLLVTSRSNGSMSTAPVADTSTTVS